MWKKLLTYFTHLLTLADATDQNRAEIKEIRKELDGLAMTVQHVLHELQSIRSDQRHEMEKLALRLENELLRFERRLPPAKHGK